MAWYSWLTTIFNRDPDAPTWENTNRPRQQLPTVKARVPDAVTSASRYKAPQPWETSFIRPQVAPMQRAYFQTPPAGQKYDPLFARYSHLYRLPPGLLSAIAYKETGGTYSNNLRSGAGARGIMQLMPPHYNGSWGRTWKSSGTPPPLISFNPQDPAASIQHAAWYIATVLQPRFRSWDKVIAAYNGGETSVADKVRRYGGAWLTRMPGETRDYVAKVGREYTGLVG